MDPEIKTDLLDILQSHFTDYRGDLFGLAYDEIKKQRRLRAHAEAEIERLRAWGSLPCMDAKEEGGCFRAVRAERLQREAEAKLREAGIALELLRKVSETGLLYKHNIDLDAEVANFLAGIVAALAARGEKRQEERD